MCVSMLLSAAVSSSAAVLLLSGTHYLDISRNLTCEFLASTDGLKIQFQRRFHPPSSKIHHETPCVHSILNAEHSSIHYLLCATFPFAKLSQLERAFIESEVFLRWVGQRL